MGAPELKQP